MLDRVVGLSNESGVSGELKEVAALPYFLPVVCSYP